MRWWTIVVEIAWLPWRIAAAVRWCVVVVLRLGALAFGWALLVALLALLGDLAREKTPARHASSDGSPAAVRVSGSPDPKAAHDADPRRQLLAPPTIGTPPKRHAGNAGKRELLAGP